MRTFDKYRLRAGTPSRAGLRFSPRGLRSSPASACFRIANPQSETPRPHRPRQRTLMTVLHSPQLDSSPWESTEAAPPTRLRVIVNRFVFRAMLFTMGMTAVVLYRVVPDKTVTWRFAK